VVEVVDAIELLRIAAMGAISGGIAAGVRYVERKVKSNEKLDPVKAINAVIAGAIIGLFTSQLFGWSYAQAEQLATCAFVAGVTDGWSKSIWKWWKAQKNGGGGGGGANAITVDIIVEKPTETTGTGKSPPVSTLPVFKGQSNVAQV
jgi:hypothetical protein